MEIFGDDLVDYAVAGMKLLLACSPIIGIGLVLAFAHEDEEKEEEKRKNSLGCKS
jgi:hypothetical protein